jgi:hypothetical protein
MYQRFGGTHPYSEELYFSETLVPTYKTTRCHEPEDHNMNSEIRQTNCYVVVRFAII